VSKGPTPVPVPKVVGLNQDEAVAALEAEGFVVDVRLDFSNKVERGKVIWQEPAKGTDLQPGRTVTIVVSQGPEVFALPSFVGMSKDAAVVRIRELGLVPQLVPVPGGNGNTVVSQLPAAGATVRVGDSIALYVA
jgi:beta-lactam-binding protein with PASTA domain